MDSPSSYIIALTWYGVANAVSSEAKVILYIYINEGFGVAYKACLIWDYVLLCGNVHAVHSII